MSTTTLHQPTWRRLALALLASASLLLGGCAAMRAQNPDSPLAPVRASAIGDDSHVMLDGHDVVAYFTENRHAKGQPQFKSQFQGVTFHFASAAHKALFDAAPQKYLPQYGGFCANGIMYGIPWGGDADTWRIIDGKLYIFGGAGSRDAFLLDVPGNRKLADQYWATEVAGSNSFWQRSKRLVFRVPHYASGEELARRVAAARAAAKP
jgi:YHS domain-containing protein